MYRPIWKVPPLLDAGMRVDTCGLNPAGSVTTSGDFILMGEAEEDDSRTSLPQELTGWLCLPAYHTTHIAYTSLMVIFTANLSYPLTNYSM